MGKMCLEETKARGREEFRVRAGDGEGEEGEGGAGEVRFCE